MKIEIPEDLTGLSNEDLEALATNITERAAELAQAEEFTDESVSEIETLAAGIDRVDGEKTSRQEAAAELAAKAQAGLARFQQDGETSETTEMSETDVLDEGATIVDLEATESAAAEEDDTEEEEDVVEPPQAVVAAGKKVGSLRTMAASQPAATRARPSKGSGHMVATHHTSRPEGSEFESVTDIARAIVDKRLTFGNIANGSRDYLTVALGRKEIPHEIAGDPEQNFGILRNAAQDHQQALVASGTYGLCAPFTPLYEFYRLAEPQTPIEDAMPVVQAPRGGIRFISPPDFRDAFAGIGTRVEADVTAETPDKPCVAVECPVVSDCSVTAVSQCVTWGNLQYRTFPEQVEAFMEDLAVAFAYRKEATYLTAIDTCSTSVTATSTYGASRSLLQHITQAATGYRKRNGMRRTATLNAMLPDWSVDLIKIDLTNDGFAGATNFLNVTDAQVLSALRDRGIEPVFYNDIENGAGRIGQAQAAGTLLSMPDVVVWYLYSPGHFVRLDGGTLDVGLVRDSSLNRSNDLELFMEEWTGLCCVGIESIKVTSVVCPNGSYPEAVTPFTC